MLELLLVAFLLFLFAISWRQSTNKSDKPDKQSEKVLSEVSNNLNNICNTLETSIEFNLHPSDKTYVKNKKDIYLAIKDKNGKFYDKNSINLAAIHELAHILCPAQGHGPLFKSIEESLIKIALDKKICTQRTLVNNYPCSDI